MKITVLIENTSLNDLACEHGLSLLIEYNDKKYLLDTGASDAFLDNAKALSIDVNDVECSVLSHGHFDHSGGYHTYLKDNDVKVYAMKNAFCENCGIEHRRVSYIGIPKEVEKDFKDRFVLVDEVTQIQDDVYIVPHSTPDLKQLGKRYDMYVLNENGYMYDDFSHELSLVFDTKNGLIIFNSCSHAGIPNIIHEVKNALPDKKIYAYFGGLHMYGEENGEIICTFSDEEVKAMSDFLIDEDVHVLYTGHCTGNPAYLKLKEHLGDKVKLLSTGMNINL